MNSFMRPAVQKDIELVQPPTESISKIAFSPTQDILAVGSWDNNVSGTTDHGADFWPNASSSLLRSRESLDAGSSTEELR